MWKFSANYLENCRAYNNRFLPWTSQIEQQFGGFDGVYLAVRSGKVERGFTVDITEIWICAGLPEASENWAHYWTIDLKWPRFQVDPKLRDSIDYFGRTPLMYCVLADRLNTAKYLIRQGAQVACVDNHGRSAVHIAAHKLWIIKFKLIL